MKDILEGLKIIEKYNSESNFCADHDQIWVYCNKLEEYTKEDLIWMEELNWFIDEENEGWSHFC